MALGAAKTDRFQIGVAELRVGPLSAANKLTQAHSVGLIDEAAFNLVQNRADVMGGFPRQKIASAVISEDTTITGTLREYTHRNLKMLLSRGVGSVATDISTTAAATAAAGATALSVATGTGADLTGGDMLVVYPELHPENISVVLIKSITNDEVTLDDGTPLLHDVAIGDKVYVARQVPLGASSGGTNYFAVQLLWKENATGRPVGVSLWKAELTSGTGLNITLGGEDFDTTEFSCSPLEPSLADYADGGVLEHLAGIIPSHPVGMLYMGGNP